MIQEILKEKQKLINHRLAVLLKADRVEHETLYSAMNYSLLAGGKRIRPFLFLTVLDILGVDSGLYIDAACALECVHTYSLIHDDLPAMDNDDYRRGRLTNHKVYGAGMATQAGDGLLTFAFQLLSEQKQIAPDIRVELISLLARAAGPEGMVGGQAHDIEAEGKHLTLSELKILDACKTGCLLSAPVSMACAVAGTSMKERALLENFAAHLGLLFQITDDLLDEKGNLEDMGKCLDRTKRTINPPSSPFLAWKKQRNTQKKKGPWQKKHWQNFLLIVQFSMNSPICCCIERNNGQALRA